MFEILGGRQRLARSSITLQHGRPTLQKLVTIPEGMPSILVHDKVMARNATLERHGAGAPRGQRCCPRPMPTSPRPERALPSDPADAEGDGQGRSPSSNGHRREHGAGSRPRRKQALILASIVEKETGLAAERATVAGVYGNRLKLNMLLQADPTVIYPVTKGRPLGRRILESELHAKNGYNTYAEVGLPVGPICNPGRASIHAVLHPAVTKALYFVANGKGGHVFADTLAEQDANVKAWFAIRHASGEM